MQKVRSPGVIKLFGEHAVVYGKTAVAAAIGMYSYASFEKNDNEYLTIFLKDMNKLEDVDKKTLAHLERQYREARNIKEYISSSEIDKDILPYATIAAKAYALGADIAGKLSLHSEIPMQRGERGNKKQ